MIKARANHTEDIGFYSNYYIELYLYNSSAELYIINFYCLTTD